MPTSRRELMALGMAGAFLSLQRSARAEDSALSAVEEANVKLVNDFCAAWSTLDPSQIVDFTADKIVYQMIDNMPLVKGKEALTKFITPFLGQIEKAEWEILRTHAIGNIVINERVDNFYSKNGKSNKHFKVVGLFLIKDGKIAEWKDYRLPKTDAEE